MEDQPFRSVISLHVPLEALVKSSASSAAFTQVRTVPCYYSGNDFRFRVPASADLMTVEPGDHPAAALETESEVVVVFPAIPSLVDGLKRAAADPAAWKAWYEAWSVDLATRPVTVQAATGPEGETLLSALVKPGEEAASWQSTVATLHEIRWQGHDVWLLLASRVFGGPGRLASALAEEERRGGPLLKAARGDIFWSYTPELRGIPGVEALSQLGLTHSAVSNGELRRWDLVQAYREKHPDGVRFLSANLVYSSATAVTLLPAYDIVESGGLRVALVGVTPASASKYLAQAGLANAKVEDGGRAVARLLPGLRPLADAVVLLGDLPDDADRLDSWLRGVDLALARTDSYTGWQAPPPDRTLTQPRRAPFQEPLLVGRAFSGALGVWEARVGAVKRGGRAWTVRETHRLLDDATPEPEGALKFDPAIYGVTASTEAPLLPSASRVFGEPPGSPRRLIPRDFWTLAAALAADETRSEAALLRVSPLASNIPGDLPDAIVRSWLDTGESLEILLLKGSELKPLLAEADAQRAGEATGEARAAVRFTVGGVGADQKIHGASIDDAANYRVAVDRVLADALGLSAKHAARLVRRPLDELVFESLLRRRGEPPEEVRRWVEGRPVADRGLWLLNFRDVGLNVQNTKVVRDDAFNGVPNSRIQGFDELLIGGEFKADADYLLQPYRWSNTLELEYARSHLRPRDAPPVTNTTANRINFLTTGTKRVGVIKENWFARQWGPSLGLQYDGQFEAAPGLKRKQIYSALPGVSFYDGTWVRNFELTANIKRDLSRDPPNTQTGLHTRLLVSKDIGPSPVKLQGELWTNYFFLTKTDTAQDLRVEGDANLKLRVPLRRYLSVAPFVDFYYFQLKTQPLWGYSAMMGVQIGFARLWKPQYEGLLGER